MHTVIHYKCVYMYSTYVLLCLNPKSHFPIPLGETFFSKYIHIGTYVLCIRFTCAHAYIHAIAPRTTYT